MRFLVNNILAVTQVTVKYKTNDFASKITRLYCAAVRNREAASKVPPTGKTTTELPTTTAQETVAVQRSLHVAVIGVPNVGKSTFINNLINHRVCPTSSKVHTTRKANTAICTNGNTQLVFIDTPGLVTKREIKKHHLEQSFKSAYRYAVQNADVIAVMHDISNTWTRNSLHTTVIDTLKTYHKLPSILILNKIDVLKSKRTLLDVIRTLTNNTLNGNRKEHTKLHTPLDMAETKNAANDVGNCENTWGQFSDVFLVSAITGNGLSDLQEYLLRSAKERSWTYPSDSFTSERPEELIVDAVRARLLDYLPQEIPYNLNSALEYYSVSNNIIYASVQVICPTARIERLICGVSNGKLRQITERVTSDLVETFGKPVSLTISTISKDDKK